MSINPISQTQLFLDKFKTLEQKAKELYYPGVIVDTSEEVKIINKLINDRRFGNYRENLRYIREVRNLYSHYPAINKDFAVYISEAMMGVIDEVLRTIGDPKKALECSVKRSEMFVASLNDSVMKIAAIMHSNKYSYVPVLEHEKIVGVFSENTLFTFMIEHGIDEISPDSTLEKYADYLPVDKHSTECFQFISRHENLFDIQQRFQNDIKDNSRLACVFVTERGSPSEKILGMITAWDILKQ